jgi:hypothetical protein
LPLEEAVPLFATLLSVPLTEASLRQLRAYNEMLHVIAKQFLAGLRGMTVGYPHDVFLQALLEDAQHGGCAESLSWAIDKCLMAANGRQHLGGLPL